MAIEDILNATDKQLAANVTAKQESETAPLVEPAVPVNMPTAAVTDPAVPTTETTATLDTFNKLEPAEKQAAIAYAKGFNIDTVGNISDFGAETQMQLSQTAESNLRLVKNKDISGDISDGLGELMVQLQLSDPDKMTEENQNIFTRLFSKGKQNFLTTRAKYTDISTEIDVIAQGLSDKVDVLKAENSSLEQMKASNIAYYKQVTLLIAAGELKAKEAKEVTLVEKERLAAETGDQLDAQEVNRWKNLVDTLNKKVFDLKLTRTIALQQAPQIELIIDGNTKMVQKVQDTITHTIPLWKNQIGLTLSLMKQKQTVEVQRQVADTTNQLLLKNAETLKMNTIDIAKENERSIVSVDTLKAVQKDLQDTITETDKIRIEGAKSRVQAAAELAKLEEEMKTQILQGAATYRKDVDGTTTDSATDAIEHKAD